MQYLRVVGWRSKVPTADWIGNARKVAGFIEPVPLIELTTPEVKEFRWAFMRGRPHCIDGLDILLCFLRWLKTDQRTKKKLSTWCDES